MKLKRICQFTIILVQLFLLSGCNDLAFMLKKPAQDAFNKVEEKVEDIEEELEKPRYSLATEKKFVSYLHGTDTIILYDDYTVSETICQNDGICTNYLGNYFILGNSLTITLNKKSNSYDWEMITPQITVYTITQDNAFEKQYSGETYSYSIKDNTLQMICKINDSVKAWTHIFDFDEGKITKYRIILEIPDELNVQDYYTEEQISNGGRYKISLENNKIIRELDPSMPFWQSSGFKYKDMEFRYINKEFVEAGYDCEV